MPEVAPTALAVPHSRIRELADIAMRMDASAGKPSERVLRLFFGESNLPTPAFSEGGRPPRDAGRLHTMYIRERGASIPAPGSRSAL